ncbi:micronuclear linker histone polyprotein-like isoform X3 [Dermacentor albipictus]|uniref:micronuclear linker histone polyprotein-like isoform X3 n=1 Tax=Dermacentor albipictus TaxID=60249 RepID=UPI0038FCF371
MLSAGKSKSNTGSKRTSPSGRSGSRGSPPSEAKIDSASNRTGARGGSSSNGRPAGSDKKPSPSEVSHKPSSAKASPGTDIAADRKASASAPASPSRHKKKSSSAKQSKSRTKRRASAANSTGLKETEAEDGGKHPACSTSPADVATAEHREHKSSPGGQQSHKVKLKMPDGTYLGVGKRNRYIRQALQRDYNYYSPQLEDCGKCRSHAKEEPPVPLHSLHLRLRCWYLHADVSVHPSISPRCVG